MRVGSGFAAVMAVILTMGAVPAAAGTPLPKPAPRPRATTPALIPAPREMRILPGEVRLGPAWTVVWSATPDDSSTAVAIAGEAERCFGFRLALRHAPTNGPCIVLAPATDTLDAPRLDREQGYRLTIEPTRITIAAPRALGRFYGAQTLRQLFRDARAATLPRLAIHDYPALEWRGVSEDMSRGRLPDAASLDATLEHLAYYKINLYQPYVESLDDLLDAPPRADRFSRRDLLALFEAGRRHHIAVCPIVATVSHRPVTDLDDDHEAPPASALDPLALAWEGGRAWLTAYLASGGTTNAIGGADLARLEQRVTELARIAPGPFLSLGGDEWTLPGDVAVPDTAALGYGRAMATLIAAARQPGRITPMMYADVIQTYPGAADPLPRDVVLVDWDYYGINAGASLDSLHALGFRQVFTSPAIWNWSTFYPNHARAFADIAALADAARRADAPGCITASWGDGGGECLAENSWPGFAFAAAATWGTTAPEPDAFLESFVVTEFGTHSLALVTAIHVLGWREFAGYANTGRLMNRPLVVRAATPRFRDEIGALEAELAAARTAADSDAARARFQKDEIRAMRHAIARYAYIARREWTLDRLGLAIARSPDGRLPAAECERAARDLRTLADEAGRLESEYRALWLAHNRPTGLDVVATRLGRQAAMGRRLSDLAAAGRLTIDESFRDLQAVRDGSPDPR
jgi:Glycosyl hydrolase family 20, domain 2